MSNSTEDKVLGRFFDKMKEKDKGLALPPYPSPTKSGFWSFFPIGIAASLLLLIWFFGEKDTPNSLHQDIIIIRLEEGVDHEWNLSIEQTSAMDIWTPTTSSLLTEF